MLITRVHRLLLLSKQIKPSKSRTTRPICLTGSKFGDDGPPSEKQIVVHGSFEDIPDKNKTNYLDMIKIFINRDHVHRRGHVEFIYAALKNMEEFRVNKDLEVYKSLIEVLPKGKFIPTNLIQAEFMHYPKQQQCIIDLLEQMEDNGVMPDYEMEDIIGNVFGKRSFPIRKYWRMMYWMPKFRHLTPWPVPEALDGVEALARAAIERITSVDPQTAVRTYQSRDIADAIDDTYIISGQSATQQRLLAENDPKEPLYVEGPFRVWLRHSPVNYFILRTCPRPFHEEIDDSDDVSNISVPFFNIGPPINRKKLRVVQSVHEQEDGTILAVCATGTSSKDSLLSWIRHLEREGNGSLATAQVVFTLRMGAREVATLQEAGNRLEGLK